ncbi:MAG: hypothetical protein U0W40_00345 [Acidimicrobiia bacterium]
MSEPPRLHQQKAGPSLVGAPGYPRVVRIVAAVLLGLALAALGWLLLTGSDTPTLPALLLFVGLFALSTNHDVVFPAPYAASADLAVLLAAVVAFRGNAAFVGPVLVGLAAGPLDVVHWRRRAFLQMTWNSGARALIALAAAGAFAAVTATAGSSVPALVGAAVAAVLAATVVDAVVSLLLVAGLGSTLRQGWRAMRDIDVLQVPLMCAGAASGFLATVGLWAVVPPMVAVVLSPEIVQARLHVSGGLVRNALLVLEVAVAATVVAPFVAVPDPLTVVALILLAALVGADLVVDGRTFVPAVLGVAVVVAALAVAGDDGVFAGLLVAAVATAVAWSLAGPRAGSRWRASSAVGLAAVAGALAGAIADRVHGLDAASVVLCLGAVAAFTVVTLVGVRQGERVAETERVLWLFPVAAAGVVVAPVAGSLGDGWPVAAAAMLGLCVVAVAWCGATPWRSRVLSPSFGRVAGRGRTAVAAVALVVASGAALVAPLAHGDALAAVVMLAAGGGGGAIAMALVATRQWRFAPMARTRGVALLAVAVLLLATGSVAVATGDAWGAALVVAAAAVTWPTGRGSLTRADDAGAELSR